MNDEKKDKKKQKLENKLQETHKKLQRLKENPEFRNAMDIISRRLQLEIIQSFLIEFES